MEPTRPAKAFEHRFDQAKPRALDRILAVEAPVNLVYGTIPYAVMMASPADLEDFAYGFSLTEGVIQAADDIRGLSVEEDEKGIRLLVDLKPERLHHHLSRVRNIAGRTACGLCGIEDLDALRLARPLEDRSVRTSLDSIRRALETMERAQALNLLTRAAHAAAWFAPDGTAEALREDVGRHNALDKLIGARLRQGGDPASGFVVITSRCSFEMVEKAAVYGAGILVAISAPTSLAVDRASALGLTLVAIARGDSATSFTGHDLLVFDPVAA